MNLHLNRDQIDELLRFGPSGKEDSTTGCLDETARIHIQDCEICQARVRAEGEAMERLAHLRAGNEEAGSPQCPPDYVLLELAAGIVRQDFENVLSHAAQCDHCGPLLRQAKEDFDNELTSEEQRSIARSTYTSNNGQRTLARELGGQFGLPPIRSLYQSKRPVQLVPLIAAIFVVAILGAGTLGWYFWRHSPGELVARAYEENRTIEMRMEGTPYARLAPKTKSQDTFLSRMDRQRLIEAESEISRSLKTDPDNVRWMQALGRVSLLEGDANSALTLLIRADQLEPSNESIKVDLATAYYQHGEADKALNILGPLAAAGKNETALFNYALALESAPLPGESIEAWGRFLKLYPKSRWAAEARSHLNKLQQQTSKQKNERAIAAVNAHRLAEDIAGGQVALLDEMDEQPERFLEIALTDWLPHIFSGGQLNSRQTQIDLQAVFTLSRIMSKGHGDTWLEDFLRTNNRTPQVIEGVRLDSLAREALAVSDSDRSIVASRQAISRFKRAHSRAGGLYARFELAYANQLSHRNLECGVLARGLLQDHAIGAYPWLQIQAEIEAAICASLSDARAFEQLHNASVIALDHRYPILHARAEQVLASIEWESGNARNAQSRTEKGLKEFWEWGLPSLRGYNLLTNLDYLAEDDELWSFRAAVIREAIPLIAGDPDKAMLAFEWSRLGETLTMAGDLDEADRSFHKAQELFRSVPRGSRLQNLTAEADIGLANLDIRRSRPLNAVQRLRAIQRTIYEVPDDDLRLTFLQSYGVALSKTGEREAAQQTFQAATNLAEASLHNTPNERDRFRWMRRNEISYRKMVELNLDTDPEKALAYWEYYRGASLRSSTNNSWKDSPASDHQSWASTSKIVAAAKTQVVVSYFLSTENVYVWVVAGGRIQGRSIPLRLNELESLILRFHDECSQPHSNLRTIQLDGLELYRQLLVPIEPLLKGHDRLIIEADGVMTEIPFGALVDETGRYLGDRYEIVVSPGIQYSDPSLSAPALSRNSRVLVVGTPSAPGWGSSNNSELEATAVAGMFKNSRLLLRKDATYGSVSADLPDVEIFHFSGHGFANSNSAGLILDDALLDAYKVEGLHFPFARLVVLSACMSGRGSRGFFDDEDSLPRIFLASRVYRVIASNWMVDSLATQELMTRFYAKLLGGHTIEFSWNAAVRELRSENVYAHPYYWAGFTIFGTT